MKAEIIILLMRDYSIEEIEKLTGYKRALIYYYNRQYKTALKKIEELKTGAVQ